MISLDFIDSQAAKSQIDRYTIIREYVQLLFLRYFYENNRSQIKAFFKGGTAIRFLFNSFRFSEDLDFTCTGSMIEIKKSISDIVPRVETEAGCRILVKDEKTFKEIGVGYRLVLQPNEYIRQPLGIRLDFSFREKPLEPEVSSISVYEYPISPFPLVTHLSVREIMAEKVRALFVRGMPRDVFDIWYLMKKGVKLDWKLLDKKMKYYPEVNYDRNILQKKIQEFKTEDLRKDLNQFLPVSYRNYYQKIVEEVLRSLK